MGHRGPARPCPRPFILFFLLPPPFRLPSDSTTMLPFSSLLFPLSRRRPTNLIETQKRQEVKEEDTPPRATMPSVEPIAALTSPPPPPPLFLSFLLLLLASSD